MVETGLHRRHRAAQIIHKRTIDATDPRMAARRIPPADRDGARAAADPDSRGDVHRAQTEDRAASRSRTWR
ncbi:hypothetical protein [Parafrankia sp. EUN1f]|uniref:hypothetical protein n=1 Tax=Parafrankia sp. EUN1f TaxID=102897 RepID=UPI0001C442FC|nr:hypothetical protein [Parafrankia sp. EUN1f]EFC84564.1 hypothetical protein FrEUN1fDRAFT_2354 [Parafrankia sp. EUN1f]